MRCLGSHYPCVRCLYAWMACSLTRYCCGCCRLPRAEQNLLKDKLMNVVANAIYYNPVLALQQLQQQGRLQHFFATWFQVSDGLLHFPRTFLS